jgi:phospholipase C
VVILIQENRSFDHYFGTRSGVRGFRDPKARPGVFAQRGADGKIGRPFHLETNCIADNTHDWGPQHQAWNHGRIDQWLSVHETADTPSNPSAVNPGSETMGYYTREDLPLYHGLADALTICDGCHCSVIGPTD